MYFLHVQLNVTYYYDHILHVLKECKLPKLVRRDAVRPPLWTNKTRTIEIDPNKEYIDFNILQRFDNDQQKYLYTKRNCDHLINGYTKFQCLNDSFKWIDLSHLNGLISKYYFQKATSIFHLAYKLWLFRGVQEKKKRKDGDIDNEKKENSIFIKGFSGYQCFKNMQKLLIRGSFFGDIDNGDGDGDGDECIKNHCRQLIKENYIELAAYKEQYSFYFENNLDDNILSDNIKSIYSFYKSKHCIYKFTSKCVVEFQEYKKYLKKHDRKAWNIGTVINVKSHTYQKWMKGTITSIKKSNDLTVVFGQDKRIIKKDVKRYDYNSIKSTKKFIQERKKLTKNSKIKIFCWYYDEWFDGIVKDVIIMDPNRNYQDKLEIEYNINNSDSYTEIISRWSPEIKINVTYKNNNSVNDNFVNNNSINGYKVGEYCNVWSKSQNRMVSATISQLIPYSNCIIVKYGKYKKVVPLS